MTWFPRQPEALTAAWLTDRLRDSGAVSGASVLSLDCRPIDLNRGMTGVLVRLTLHYDVAEAAAPRSLIAKFSQPDPGFRGLIHGMGFFEREVHFYNEFARDVPVPTPRCYYAGVDQDDGWCLLLLEDLAPARTGSWFVGSDREELETAITSIAAVHASWWQSPRLQASWLTMTSFVSPQEMQGMAVQCWPSFLSQLSVPVTPAVVATGELLSRHLQAVCAYLLETPPLTLIHHDFHGDNLMFSTLDGRLGVVVLDWQLTTRAHAAVDVGWLVGGQCEPEDRRENELDLVRMYHGLLVDQGVSDYSFDRCWDDYRLSMLLAAGRTSTAVGARPAGLPGGPWDKIVPRYCQAVSDLGVDELVASMSLGGVT